MARDVRHPGLRRLVHALALSTLVACGGCSSYLAYGRLVLFPDAAGVAREFLARLCAGDAGGAHRLMGTARAPAPPAEAFALEVGARDLLFTRVKRLELRGRELDGLTRMTLAGPIGYENGTGGEALVALEREGTEWRVTAYDVASPALIARQKDDARRVAQELLEALRGADWSALERTLHPELVKRKGEDKLRALQKGLARRADDSKFVETRTGADHPKYELNGVLRGSDGPPMDVHIQLRWERATGIRVTEFTIEPSASWLADQKLLARQAGFAFIAALRTADAPAAVGVCHPRLVATLTEPKLVELARQFPLKLADVVFDEARSSWRHPTYELVGMQKTLSGPELPAAVTVQYVEGRHWVTGFRFE